MASGKRQLGTVTAEELWAGGVEDAGMQTASEAPRAPDLGGETLLNLVQRKQDRPRQVMVREIAEGAGGGGSFSQFGEKDTKGI